MDEMRDIQTEVSENADRVQEYVDTMDTVSGLRAGEIENTGGHTCDLNSYVRPATFLFSGDAGMGAVANAPTGQMAGFLQVLGNSQFLKQVWYPFDDSVNSSCVRTGHIENGAMVWGSWHNL